MSDVLPQTASDRPVGQAMTRGALGRCPSCGQGRLMQGYLSVRDTCQNCGEPMHHQRADDGPAYLTILVVSHLLTPLLLAVFVMWRPSVTAMLFGFLGAAIVMSLALLPVIKGAMVGLQWARRMHGFGDDERTAR